MPDYTYLIIGGGMTADAAVRGIRSTDSSSTIGMITNEQHPPYDRPPLSKALWKGEAVESVWRKTIKDNLEIHLSKTVKSIDIKNNTVADDQGMIYSYKKLLFATGGSVRRLSPDVDSINYFRTLDDYYRLRDAAEQGQSFLVIGGGFIGSEIAAALAMNNKSVTMVFPEEGICSRVFPENLSLFVNEFYDMKGVQVLHGDGVASLTKTKSSYDVRTKAGKEFQVDGVIAGLGIQPNVELAQSAGVAVDNGIIVDEFLQTNVRQLYAAGDVANFYNPALGKRMRAEHEDNANTMGEFAGRNMAGDPVAYDHLPFFYSDLFELGYEAVGELDSRMNIFADWKEEFREGVIYYLDKERVRGVLLWNTWGQVNAARQLIAEKGPFNKDNLKGRITG